MATKLDENFVKTIEENPEQAMYGFHTLCHEVRRLEGYCEQLESKLKDAKETLEELTLLMDDTVEGSYRPDSFTTQPAQEKIRELETELERVHKFSREDGAMLFDALNKINGLESKLKDAKETLEFYEQGKHMDIIANEWSDIDEGKKARECLERIK